MKLLVLTSRFPYPIEKGDKLRIYHQLRLLSKRYELVLVSLTDQPIAPEDQAHIEDMVARLYVFRLQKVGIFWHLLKALILGQPFQMAYFYRKSIHRQIQDLIQTERPDHIYCQLLRMAAYVKGTQIPATIDYMDAFSKGMERQAQAEVWWKTPFFHREAKLLAAYEPAIYPDFVHHTLISAQDYALMQFRDDQPVHILPNGINTTFFAPLPQPQPTVAISFVGNLGYFPNIKAAQYLVQEIMPLVWRVQPEAKVLLAGARPHAQVKALAQDSRVNLTGWVADIRTAYAAGKVFVAPIFTGSGQQNKLLEAMAMERPCITTSLVNNAIQAPDLALRTADTPAAFATHIIDLLGHPERGAIMGRHARLFVQHHFNWEVTVASLAALMERNTPPAFHRNSPAE